MHEQAKVFIGGSRCLSRLSQDVKHRLDKIIEKSLTVIVGDANGADKAVQRYLASKSYDRVTVFCMAGECRNNLGNWPTREVESARGVRRDSTHYGMKDRAMAGEADYGLMLWDGKSRGTLTNIEDLVRNEKPVVVYLAPDKSFVTLREPDQLLYLLGQLNSTTPHRSIRGSHVRRSHPSRSVLLF